MGNFNCLPCCKRKLSNREYNCGIIFDSIERRTEVINTRGSASCIPASNLILNMNEDDRFILEVNNEGMPDQDVYSNPLLNDELKLRLESISDVSKPITDIFDELVGLNSLAFQLYQKRDLYSAKVIWNSISLRNESVLGFSDPFTLDTLNNLAIILFEEKFLREAESIFEKIITEKQVIHGLYHMNTLTSVYNLGCVLYEMGRIKESKVFYERSLKGFLKTLGISHQYTKIANSSLNLILIKHADVL